MCVDFLVKCNLSYLAVFFAESGNYLLDLEVAELLERKR